jgi:sec-independent protein translocase protein TatB
MFNLDPGKLLVIAVVAIILLGPDKLPQFARQVGGAWRSFNEFRHRMEAEVRNTMPDLPPTSEIARLARSPSALLDHLSSMSSDEDDEEPDGSFQPPAPADGTAGAASTNGTTSGQPPAEGPAPSPADPAVPPPADSFVPSSADPAVPPPDDSFDDSFDDPPAGPAPAAEGAAETIAVGDPTLN